MSFLYLVVLLLYFVIYIAMCLLMPEFKNINIANMIFYLISFVCYITLVIYLYFHDGPKDWNFTNALPTANVSPFMFFTSFIFFLLPKKIKKYHALLISLLSVGMILSSAITMTHNFIISYRFIPSFLLDYTAHFAFSLWGVYFIQSKQVELKNKDCLISGSLIMGVALTMLIINLIFDTSFFGLSLRGKHNIYNQVLVSNSFLSALIYFSGLVLVLFLGYLLQKMLLVVLKERK